MVYTNNNNNNNKNKNLIVRYFDFMATTQGNTYSHSFCKSRSTLKLISFLRKDFNRSHNDKSTPSYLDYGNLED